MANVSDTPLATYTYLGTGHVAKTYLEEPDAYSSVINAAGDAYEGLDQFNRPIKSRWTKDLTTDVDFFSVNVGWDRASNVQYQDDQVQVGHDTLYANDARNRLTDAEEGTLTIGTPNTIDSTTRTRRQEWSLTQTGNWTNNKVDLDGDGSWSDPDELNETRVHNQVNELQSRDTNSSSPVEFNLTYDAVGSMTSDNENYQYKWDAFGRLREVTDLSNNVVSEYWYNGLGYLTVRLQDTNSDGVADPAEDRKYVTIFDERWRQVATYRVNPSTGVLDANPKEQFVYHAAGSGGWGGSSYIDSVILRNKDANSWTGVGGSSLSKTLYYCQNWRADVVVLLDGTSSVTTLVQNVRYSAYGVPFGIPYGDVNGDGICNTSDATQVSTWINGSAYNVRGDLDLDGDVDSGDLSEVQANVDETLGYGVLSDRGLRNRKGYAGYEGDSSLSAVWHVRHRVLESKLGRWLRRDPLGYIETSNLLEYARSAPSDSRDPQGLYSEGRFDACEQFRDLYVETVFLGLYPASEGQCKFLLATGCACACKSLWLEQLEGCKRRSGQLKQGLKLANRLAKMARFATGLVGSYTIGVLQNAGYGHCKAAIDADRRCCEAACYEKIGWTHPLGVTSANCRTMAEPIY